MYRTKNMSRVSTLFLLLMWSSVYPQRFAIKAGLGGARLGDKLIAYCKSKYISYVYDVPLIFCPFPHSDQLAMSTYEQQRLDIDESSFKKKYILKAALDVVPYVEKARRNRKTLFKTRPLDTIFLNGYYAGFGHAGVNNFDADHIYLLTVQNQGFGAEIKKMLQPIIPIKLLELPKDKITVAVHIRKGCGDDKPLCADQYFSSGDERVVYTVLDAMKAKVTDLPFIPWWGGRRHEDLTPEDIDSSEQTYPIKFPPEQFYVDHIIKLSEMLGDVPMYVFLFTDDLEPQQLLERIREHVNKPNIGYATTQRKESKDAYIDTTVQDFCQIAQFDCLIRADSLFSWISQLVGNHKIIIYPIHNKWVTTKKLLMDWVNIFLRKPEAGDSKEALFSQMHWK